jgi:glycosyltransferase involved in cell wall biosynthesis
MPRFANMLADGMTARNHKVEVWSPQPIVFQLPAPAAVKKWLGYIDQFVFFPIQVRKRAKRLPRNTLFVFTDHALGPWIPILAKRPHVIHCHDFLAQYSALGMIPENSAGWSGKKYQAFIRRGFKKGKNFISVSHKTSQDLHYFLSFVPAISAVVYNGLNFPFYPADIKDSRDKISKQTGLDLHSGYILHLGGNQWYKNRKGVIEIYNAWRSISKTKVPLLLVGEAPDKELLEQYSLSQFKTDIHFLSGLSNESVRLAYAGAAVFLFPSIGEGFGWPIAEAMACGCPVITTNEAPMTEVAKAAGFYISRYPTDTSLRKSWAAEAARVVEGVLSLSFENRRSVIEDGLKNVERFDTNRTLDQIERVYEGVLKTT